MGGDGFAGFAVGVEGPDPSPEEEHGQGYGRITEYVGPNSVGSAGVGVARGAPSQVARDKGEDGPGGHEIVDDFPHGIVRGTIVVYGGEDEVEEDRQGGQD